MDTPETRYVTVGDADVAYQVFGDGDQDLLFCYGLGSHIDLIWQLPTVGTYFRKLADEFRVILFDRRGTGASDGVPRGAVPTLEAWTEDIEAVLDVVGSRQAALWGNMDMGPIVMLYAAMHPERVSALALMNTWSRVLWAEDYPIGFEQSFIDEFVESIAARWGTREFVAEGDPSENADYARIGAQVMRASATPRTAAAQWAYMLRHDVRHVVPLLKMPTLVMTSPQFAVNSQYLADNIAGAKFVMLGEDIGWSKANLVIADELIEFLTGERPAVEVDRILATVLFTDIVGSTERAASLGDQKWRALLDAHDRIVREQLRRFRGREINTTGDGFVASFDGPARAIQCAQAIVDATKAIDLEVRAGLHTGECEVRGDDLGGLAVHIAARVCAQADSGEVLASAVVKDLVAGSGIEFDERGEHALAGLSGEWRLFAAQHS
jgi:class 3 adenylate cyclase